MIRLLFLLAIAGLVTWCSTTVPLGQHTFAGHVSRIWDSNESKDLREGVREKATSEATKRTVEGVADHAGPVVDRVVKGIKTGVRTAIEDPDSGPPARDDSR